MKKTIYQVLYFLYIACCSGCIIFTNTPYQKIWPYRDYGGASSDYNEASVVDGYIILNNSLPIRIIKYSDKVKLSLSGITVDTVFNNDTLKGLIKLWVMAKHDPGINVFNTIDIYPNNSNKWVYSISCKDIKFVFGNNNTNIKTYTDTPRSYSIWMSAPKYNLLRLIQSKERWKIYDNYLGIDTNYKKFGSVMIIVNDNKRQIVYDHLHFPVQSPQKWILDFINKEFHEHFKKKDFKTIRDMLNYILDKENESEETKSPFTVRLIPQGKSNDR